jgi:steroid 5-alpha reductase family enzyme
MWELFNIGFICIYQLALLFLIVSPCLAAATSTVPFGPLDMLATALFLAFFFGEVTCDGQQWVFQSAKYAWLAN